MHITLLVVFMTSNQTNKEAAKRVRHAFAAVNAKLSILRARI